MLVSRPGTLGKLTRGSYNVDMPPDPKQTRKKLDSLRAQLEKLGYTAPGDAKSKVFSADELRRKLGRTANKAAPGKSPESGGKKPGDGTAGPPSRQTDSGSGSPIVYSRHLPRRTKDTAAAATRPRKTLRLEDAVSGTEFAQEDRGKALLVTTAIRTVHGGTRINERFPAALSARDSRLWERLSIVCEESELTPADVIFMDLETTGLGSSPLFLVGVMVWTETGFEVRQYLARHYAEEAPVIARFIDLCARKKLLITFNGKSFDFPFIRTRAAATGVPFSLEPWHFDLLHECRRIWRRKLPDCKLQTLERRVCGRLRQGDIPGSEIPDAYHAFVRTQNAVQIVEVLKHNMLDLVTLADIMTRFPARPDR